MLGFKLLQHSYTKFHESASSLLMYMMMCMMALPTTLSV